MVIIPLPLGVLSSKTGEVAGLELLGFGTVRLVFDEEALALFPPVPPEEDESGFKGLWVLGSMPWLINFLLR